MYIYEVGVDMKDIRQIVTKIEIIDSIIGAIGVAIILGAALFLQFVHKEEPCPLCLLQRAAFLNIGIALLMNVKYGNRVSHWAFAILSAVVGMTISIRQILLHINSPIGYDGVLFGFHLYTLCFIGFLIVIIGSVVMLIIYPESNSS